MAEGTKPAPRQLAELTDVYDFLEEIRLRPGMWVRRSSLQHLDSMLTGYRVALGVHDIAEPFDFWNAGSPSRFSEWLWPRLGMRCSSPLGWATEIERAAEQSGKPAMDMFFELLDEFRATGHEAHSHTPAQAERPSAPKAPTLQVPKGTGHPSDDSSWACRSRPGLPGSGEARSPGRLRRVVPQPA